ncbi:valine--tRNA ligase [Candidatus Hikarchaeum yamanae]|uniref:valine--tRNA ligase n=1 Tax=Candidatus Hikarchaeum yamanae TaxID=2675326 RepID=UPI0039ED05B8|tara:strand:+ start:71841 stop:74468 length:2628 start_codon:yes stop_codon:yes gene_type:complete
MIDFPELYNPKEIEPKWRDYWFESQLYSYEDTGAEDYVIDTPPPYPTGNFHIGNSLGWCYMDFAARYRRLQGYDVLFPQGWDCHGLPTEVKVEEKNSIHRTDIPRDVFRKMCSDYTEKQIQSMKQVMLDLGFSQDWNYEFRTMDPHFWGTTQLSFLKMHSQGHIYRSEHPVNWCPRCETAIADAEVETLDREASLHYLKFSGTEGNDIQIATTRPELLAACVAIAVNPTDSRYSWALEKSFKVPLFEHEVHLFADDSVDPEFGTGAVMICTFGDKQDVAWWAEYNLPLRDVFTEDGHLGELAGDYAGLTIDEAKSAIVTSLSEQKYLAKSENTDQSVGVCWRCDTPIEILSREQWFVKVDSKDILKKAESVDWIPAHMFLRLKEWTESMDWDWVISRQRVFATPIPAWFCSSCEYIAIAQEDELPIDPTETNPSIGTCPNCGSSTWSPETDVMDTWMDSSITPLYVRGWPENTFTPTSLREQGHDIIRTWAFYTILRTAAIVQKEPWKEALINGMVFGDDGYKMSKSRNNFVQPSEVIEEYSADAFRQAIALGGHPGSDIQFQWKEVISASRFLTKLWNIVRFSSTHFSNDLPSLENPSYRTADLWLFSKLNSLVLEVSQDMDKYRFDSALRKLRDFIWHDLADNYIELVKGRIYGDQTPEKSAALHTLYLTLHALIVMLSPFTPFICEELYSRLPQTTDSVHTSPWPTNLPELSDTTDISFSGGLIIDIAQSIRSWKANSGMALNEKISTVELYIPGINQIDTLDLSAAINAPISLKSGKPDLNLAPSDIQIDYSLIGPIFREKSDTIVSAIKEMPISDVKLQLETNGILKLEIDGSEVSINPDAIKIMEEYQTDEGKEVNVLTLPNATILLHL